MQEPTDQDMELIRRFLEFEMTPEELAAFESRLESDSVFAQLMAEYQELQRTIHTNFSSPEEEQQRQKWAGWLEEKDTNTAKPIRPNQRWWLSAAAAAAVILGLFVGYQSSLGVDYGALAAEARAQGPELKYGALRTTASSTEAQALLEGYDLLQAEQYEACLAHFSSISTVHPYYDDGLLVQSIAHQHLEQWEAAHNVLEPILQQENHPKFGMAAWQASLIYLEKNQPESARKLLEKIAQPHYRMAVEAKQLLEQL